MKCDKCEKEAMLHYESTVNGEKTEYHLCEDCARAENFGEMLDHRRQSMFRSFFGASPLGMLTDGFFGRGIMAPTLVLPYVRVKVEEPNKGCMCGEATETAEKKADNVSESEKAEFKAKRELSALKHQLKEAVNTEEYEKAAELRDKIRELEK